MDTGILNLFKNLMVNTVYASPPPDCPPVSPPSPKKKPCHIKTNSSEPEVPPGDGPNVSFATKIPPPPSSQAPASDSTGKRSNTETGETSKHEHEDAGNTGKSRPSSPRKHSCDFSSFGASNLGKAGAGVTGSRTSGSETDVGSGRGAGRGVCGRRGRARRGAGVGLTITSEDSEIDDQNEFLLPDGATNPGLLRHIHNAARYRLPQCFEGGILSVKQKSEINWVLGHSMLFSSVSPGGYKMLLSYMNKDKPTGLPYFVIETAPGGQISCEARVGPSSGTRATVMTQLANAEFKSFESIMDFYFNSSTASVIAVNREFIAVHFLQALTENLSMGCELVARGQFSEMSSASAAVRWATDDYAFSGTFGNRGLDLCFAKVVKPFLTVAALLEVGLATRRSVATLAYEWSGNDWTFRASADSDGLVGATMQRALGGERAQLACAISALLNHPNDKFRLGFGVSATII